MRALLLLVALACTACDDAIARAPAAPAAAPREAGETFTPAAPLDVRDQPAGPRLVARIEEGQAYPLLKRGGPGGAWCKLRAGSVEGWVECAEGRAGHDRPGPATPVTPEAPKLPEPRVIQGDAACETRCTHEPLFATPPELSASDREVLALCPATADGLVTRAQVRAFFTAHADDPRLVRALKLAGRGTDRSADVDWLVSLWVGPARRNAFTHVFCGDDWSDGDLGGLHWLPRFAQLEQDGKICYRGAAKGRLAEVGGQYLIRYSGLAPWSCGRKNLGGFAVRHDPLDVVAAATRAFHRCCADRAQGGRYRGPDTGSTTWQIWCGTRNGAFGIATFYPVDGRPDCGE